MQFIDEIKADVVYFKYTKFSAWSPTCAEGRKLPLRRENSELVDGHFVTTAHYRCESCKDCPRRSICCQAKDPEKPKEVTLKKTFWEKRAESQKNITTERGIYLRMCRSI